MCLCLSKRVIKCVSVVLSNCNAVALVPTGLHLALPVSAFSVLPPHFFFSVSDSLFLSFLHTSYIMN